MKVKPGTYSAEGDPCMYYVTDDGRIVIFDSKQKKFSEVRGKDMRESVLDRIEDGKLKLSEPTLEGAMDSTLVVSIGPEPRGPRITSPADLSEARLAAARAAMGRGPKSSEKDEGEHGIEKVV